MESERRDITDGILKGALAGLAGGAALLVVEQLEREVMLPRGASTAGTAERAVREIASDRGVELPRPAAVAAGAAAQLVWCALWGAVYGAVRSRVESPAIVDALVLGGAAYAAARSKNGVLSRLGTVAPPTEQNLEQTAVDIGSHLAFGIATASVFDAAAA